MNWTGDESKENQNFKPYKFKLILFQNRIETLKVSYQNNPVI